MPKWPEAAPAFLSLGLVLGCAGAQAQLGAPDEARTGLSIVPKLSVSQMVTDNLRVDDRNKDAALATTLAPGISLSLQSPRARVMLDYSLNAMLYAKSEQKRRTSNSLTASANLELLENWLSLESRAQVGQQAISAFGTVTSSDALVNENQTELRSLSVSPVMRGRVSSLATYELRGTVTETRAKGTVAGDTSGRGASLRIESVDGAQRSFSWYVNALTQRNDSSANLGAGGARDTATSSALAGLRWRPDVDWVLGGFAGGERSNLAAIKQTSGATYGMDGSWTPTPRTVAQASWQHHSYGDSHSLSLEHRMSRTALRLSDSTTAVAPGVNGAAGRLTNYDLLYLQFASAEPDPVKRDLFVRAFLQANGLAADAVTTTGFISAGATRLRRQEASMSWTGIRTTLTGSINQSQTRRLGPQDAGIVDDLSGSGVVKQLGLAGNLSYRLTADSSASLSGSYQRTRGDLGTQATSMKSILAGWNARLGRRTTGMVNLRHTQFASSIKPYRENAVIVTLVQQF